MLSKTNVIFGFLSVIIFSGCVFVLSGCIYNKEAMPEVVTSYPATPVLIRPPAVKRVTPTYRQGGQNQWLPPARLEKSWIAIVMHHSATETGNAAIFHKWHKEDRHWDGIGYHFVIGNGTNSGDGQVEPTYRWTEQKIGAHCGGTPSNWANAKGIGICLVGDFRKTGPTIKQMNSTMNLVRFLQNRYRISEDRIYGHGTTPGAHITDCPGSNFPMARLKAQLDF